jgi:hypothetical protein
MTARFRSRCAACGHGIEAGDAFVWSKAYRKGFHVGCPTEVRPQPERPDEPNAPRMMNARFGGLCKHCHQRFEEGDPIAYMRPNAFHAACPPEVTADPAESDIDLSVLPYGTYRFAVHDGERLRFLRIDLVPPTYKDGSSRPYGGNVYVKEKGGSSEGRRLGRQVKGHRYVGEAADLLREVIADPEAAARRYGLEMRECSVCGTDLTDPDSRALGIGPVCRKRFTWKGGRVSHEPAMDLEVEVA